MYLGSSAILEHATENGGIDDEELGEFAVRLDEASNMDVEFK